MHLQAALTFARAIAQEELSAIDRMYQRSVCCIFAVVSVVLLGGTIFGWIGFKNLKDSAISTARNQVQRETITQVRDQLTSEKLEDIVATEVDGFTRHQLTAEVNREINAGPLHNQILQNAREQSQRQLSLALAPRKLSQDQADKLAEILRAEKASYAHLVFIAGLTYDVESQNYESQITNAFKAGGFELGYRNNLTTPDVFSYGVTIVYDQGYFEPSKDIDAVIFRAVWRASFRTKWRVGVQISRFQLSFLASRTIRSQACTDQLLSGSQETPASEGLGSGPFFGRRFQLQT